MFPELNFPTPELKIQRDEDQSLVWDIWRKKWVVLTPEEWVRQHIAHYFMNDLNFPPGRIAIEISLRVNMLSKRADLLVYSDIGKPLLLAECKASHIPITQATFDQVARYNITLGVPWLLVTNGLASYCCKVNHELSSIDFLERLPNYSELLNS